MNPVLKIEIQAICIVHIVSIILAIVFFMMFYIKANKDDSVKAFLVMQVSMIAWMVFKIFKTVSPTEFTRWSFIVAYYACVCIFEVAFLEFGYAYYKGRALSKKTRMTIYVLPLVQFIIVLTNPYHHLFYKTYHFFGDTFGPLFYVHVFIEYIFICVGFFYCYKMFKKQFVYKNIWYKHLISSAIIIPLILNILYITKIVHRVVFGLGIPVIFDITPILFTWSTLVFVFATFKNEFIKLSPLMKHEIVHRLDTPLCIVNSAFELVYMNQEADHLLKKNVDNTLKKIFDKKHIHQIKKDKELSFEYEDNLFCMHVYVKEMIGVLETQFLITLKDISFYKKIQYDIVKEQDEYNETNRALKKSIKILRDTSKTGARNYVARELHDIIGHSLVVTIKLLEVAKLYVKKDRKLSVRALEDAIESIDVGVSNMRAIATKGEQNNVYTGESLKKELGRMLEYVKHIDIDLTLHFKGIYYEVEEQTFDVIKKVCTELVTNSLKHANAKALLLSVNVKQDQIYILVMDNGIGTNKLIKGNGLKGIEERLKAIHGKIEFNSSENDGFMSKMSINRMHKMT